MPELMTEILPEPAMFPGTVKVLLVLAVLLSLMSMARLPLREMLEPTVALPRPLVLALVYWRVLLPVPTVMALGPRVVGEGVVAEDDGGVVDRDAGGGGGLLAAGGDDEFALPELTVAEPVKVLVPPRGEGCGGGTVADDAGFGCR